MGCFLSKLVNVWEGFNKPAEIVMLGLDAAGKTTMLYKLTLSDQTTIIPTHGFNVETVSPCKGLTLTIWDVSGKHAIRQLWQHYYPTTEGLIFVVDSADEERFPEARDELHKILEFDCMSHIPVLVFANKQDLPHAQSLTKIADVLDMSSLNSTHKWQIQACCAATGDGLVKGLTSFSGMIKEYKKSNRF